MAKLAGSRGFNPQVTNKVLNTQRASGMIPEIGDMPGNLAVTSTNINVYANGMRVGFIQSLTPSESRTITKIQELGTEGVVQSVPGNTNGGQLAISRFAVYNGNLWNSLGLTRTGKFVTKNDIQKTPASVMTGGSYGNPFKTLKDQRVPIEIKIITTMSTMTGSTIDANSQKVDALPGTSTESTNATDTTDVGYFIETYVDCWLASYSKSVASSTITITESATIQYSDVMAAYTTSTSDLGHAGYLNTTTTTTTPKA